MPRKKKTPADEFEAPTPSSAEAQPRPSVEAKEESEEDDDDAGGYCDEENDEKNSQAPLNIGISLLPKPTFWPPISKSLFLAWHQRCPRQPAEDAKLQVFMASCSQPSMLP